MKFNLGKKIIFVSGIHGVGKTTLCKKISKNLSLKHYSASQLISNLKYIDKKVSNVSENQNDLLESINRNFNNEEYYILDGHFCLLDSCGIIVRVPFETFKSLGLKAIIVLVDEEQEILNRLSHRDGKSYNIAFIKKFQENEIYYAKEIAYNIGVPLKIINVNYGIDEMQSFINSVTNSYL